MQGDYDNDNDSDNDGDDDEDVTWNDNDAGFLRDVTNKGTQLEVMRDWFNACMYQNAIRATEERAPLSYKVSGLGGGRGGHALTGEQRARPRAREIKGLNSVNCAGGGGPDEKGTAHEARVRVSQVMDND